MFGGAIATALGAAAVLAQTVDGFDLPSLQKRADATAADAQAFVDEIKRKTEAVAADAQTTVANGEANHERYAKAQGAAPGASELDRMMADVTGQAQGGQAPQFIVFASLSMPADSLRPLIRDTSKAGGAVVFQGFPGNSMKAFQQGITKIIDQGLKDSSVGSALFFHARYVSPGWHLKWVASIGNHIFYR